MTPNAQDLARRIIDRYWVAHPRVPRPIRNGRTLMASLVIPECGPLLTWGRIVEVITPAATYSCVFMRPYCIRIPDMQPSPVDLSSTAKDQSMNKRWHRWVVLALVLVAIMVAPFA